MSTSLRHRNPTQSLTGYNNVGIFHENTPLVVKLDNANPNQRKTNLDRYFFQSTTYRVKSIFSMHVIFNQIYKFNCTTHHTRDQHYNLLKHTHLKMCNHFFFSFLQQCVSIRSDPSYVVTISLKPLIHLTFQVEVTKNNTKKVKV